MYRQAFQSAQSRSSFSNISMSMYAPGIACIELEVDPQINVAKATNKDSPINDINLDIKTETSSDEYRHEHGRRYHAFKDEAYALPNDEEEIHRLDLQDLVWKLSLKGGLHISPISNQVKVTVDIGTGTGRWAIDFAAVHPQCTVIGTDLSAIQPENVPSNCTFLIQNANEEWKITELVDFIHGRMLIMGIKDWKHYFAQAWKNLIPGGWMEVQEVRFPVSYMDDGLVKSDSPLWKWSLYVQEAALKLGIDTLSPDRFKEMAEVQGFVNVNYQRFKWPMGTWPKGAQEKQLGALADENIRGMAVAALGAKLFTGALGWSEQEVIDFTELVKKEREDQGGPHYYWEMTVCSAQKPVSPTR